MKKIKRGDTLHFRMSEREYLQLVDDMTGLCTQCGTTCEMVEPDARDYECPAGCGPYVYGTEELLTMELIDLTGGAFSRWSR